MAFSHHFNSRAFASSKLLSQFQRLLEPKTQQELELMAQHAARLTRQFFGKTMRLFAPLYLSNECINVCEYCGFSRNNPILRVTLSLDQTEAEARHLGAQGFRNILLVAGEHPKFVGSGYLEDVVRRLIPIVPSLSLEVGPMETAEYLPIVQAGAEGLVVYQETYDTAQYATLHKAGPKQNFDWRLDCPERAYAAGFRRLGIGALFGLAPWREEALHLAAHTEYLQKQCWKSYLTLSFPRIRPAAGEFAPLTAFKDRDLVQTILAFRITFPQVGLILSTRERPEFRDALAPLGITTMSAGSHTEPGGYTGAGKDDLHTTERGRRVELSADDRAKATGATVQFAISDERSPQEVAERLRQLGLDPVWKDWEPVFI